MSAVDQVVGARAQRLIARAGITAWSTIGLVGVTVIVLLMLSAVSSVVLPLIFAAVLAVLFRPVAATLENRGLRPTLAAGAVVIGCVVMVVVVVVLAVRGVLDQTAQIGGQVEDALTASGLSQETADDLRDAIEGLSPVISEGVAKLVVGGISRLAGFAAGAVLGVLIMYYLIKDGRSIRRSLVGSLAPGPPPRSRRTDRRCDARAAQVRAGSNDALGARCPRSGCREPAVGSSAGAHRGDRQLRRRLRAVHRRRGRGWARDLRRARRRRG
jgi:predicted PurR-regulated permease PerM